MTLIFIIVFPIAVLAAGLLLAWAMEPEKETSIFSTSIPIGTKVCVNNNVDAFSGYTGVIVDLENPQGLSGFQCWVQLDILHSTPVRFMYDELWELTA